MLRTSGSCAAALVICLLALNGCKQKQDPLPTLLPMPGSHPNTPDKTIRPSFDKSPMDMIYYPPDYPILKMSGKADQEPVARVIYSRPEKEGRAIFGNVVKYDEPWRMGANEATEIEFFKDVIIQDKPVKKGRYVLYCVPYPGKWKIILNDDLFVWGLHIHSSKDAYSFFIPAPIVNDIYEAFTMEFAPQDKGMQLVMAWDNVRAVLPIRF